ncbi:MAG: hypothetical protein ACXABI_13525 [Candidatus Hodarchaeales archaeon]|jgi:WD40 repeat protein
MESRTRRLFSGGTGHQFSVMRVSAFHHSNRVASCSFDGTVRIWNDISQEDVLFFLSEAIECLEVKLFKSVLFRINNKINSRNRPR